MIRKLLTASIVGLGLTASTYAAPTIELAFDLLDLDGNPLVAKGDGSYDIQVGTQFQIQLSASIVDYYKTNAGRSGTTMDDKALGIKFLNLDILTPGSVGVAVPAGVWDDALSVFKWDGYTDVSARGNGVDSVNLGERDADGDLDVAGAGYFNSTGSVSTAAQLGGVQLGVNGLEPVFSGLYNAVKAGPLTIQTLTKNGIVYKDTASDNALDNEELVAATKALVEASVVVNVIGGGPTPTFVAMASDQPAADPKVLYPHTGNVLQYQPPIAIGADKANIQFPDMAAAPAGSLYALFWLTGDPAGIEAIKAAFPDVAEADGAVELVGPGFMYDSLTRAYPGANLILKYDGQGGVLDNGSLTVDFSGNGVTIAQFAAVPEPASLLSLGGLSFLGFMLGRRRR